MILDIVVGIIVGSLTFYATEAPSVRPLPADDRLPEAMLPVPPPVPREIAVMAIEELACRRPPDPTRVLRAMLDAGIIRIEDRVDFESFSCFPLDGGPSMSGLRVVSVCGGVLDPAVNAANPDLYPPNEMIAEGDRYQVLSFGSDSDRDTFFAWYDGMFPPRPDGQSGATNELYAGTFAPYEVFCDDALAPDPGPSTAAGPGEAAMPRIIEPPPPPPPAARVQ